MVDRPGRAAESVLGSPLVLTFVQSARSGRWRLRTTPDRLTPAVAGAGSAHRPAASWLAARHRSGAPGAGIMPATWAAGSDTSLRELHDHGRAGISLEPFHRHYTAPSGGMRLRGAKLPRAFIPGARRGNRTPTTCSGSADFKSAASADFAIRAPQGGMLPQRAAGSVRGSERQVECCLSARHPRPLRKSPDDARPCVGSLGDRPVNFGTKREKSIQIVAIIV